MGCIVYFSLIITMTLSLLLSFWLMGLFPGRYAFPVQIGFAGVGTLIAGSPALYAWYKNNSDQYKEDSQNNTDPGHLPAAQQSYINRILNKGAEK